MQASFAERGAVDEHRVGGGVCGGVWRGRMRNRSDKRDADWEVGVNGDAMAAAAGEPLPVARNATCSQ